MKTFKIFVITLFFLLPSCLPAADFPVTFTDSSGRSITLHGKPRRVVSLMPSVTEVLMLIGAADVLHGITYHSVLPPETAGKSIVGGFFSPDPDRVEILRPDVIFYAGLQQEVVRRFKDKFILINLSESSIEESFEHISLLGRIFRKEDEARAIVAEQKRLLDVIARKTARIPAERRQRVIRLMGRQRVMAPGDDSFQNEYIRAAGGIAPKFGRNGSMIKLSLEEWREFNPQVIYGCGGDRDIMSILDQTGWRDVDAVKNKRIFFFPCDLTCRAAAHTGYFVSWLSARIYQDEYGRPENFVLPQRMIRQRPLELDLDYIKKAEIISSDIKDFRNKTVAIRFDRPMKVVSSLEGEKNGVLVVANHYFPPPAWGLGHRQGLEGLRRDTMQVLEFDPETTAMLFTGADMDNLAVVTRSFREMKVTALVTAGVSSNGLRMGADTGAFYEPDAAGRRKKPGTINILLMSSMRLTPRAMTRAIISATEAKSAALQDLDIRSSHTPMVNPATGTGTDNIIVVEGAGERIDSSGGHSKMGELIAGAVYEGVKKAIHLQNGLVAKRSVFQRLKERKIDLGTVCRRYAADHKGRELFLELERILLDPEYAGFMKSIMAISDDYERGLVGDMSSIESWCGSVAEKISGRSEKNNLLKIKDMPPVISMGISAIITGAFHRVQSRQKVVWIPHKPYNAVNLRP